MNVQRSLATIHVATQTWPSKSRIDEYPSWWIHVQPCELATLSTITAFHQQPASRDAPRVSFRRKENASTISPPVTSVFEPQTLLYRMARPNDVHVYRHYILYTDEQHKKPRVRCKYCNDSFTKDKGRNAGHLDSCAAKKKWNADRGIEDGPFASRSNMSDADGEATDPAIFQQEEMFNSEGIFSNEGTINNSNGSSGTTKPNNKRPTAVAEDNARKVMRTSVPLVAGLAKAIAVMRGQERMLMDLVEGKANANQIEYTRHLYAKQIDDLEQELKRLED